MKKHKFTNPKGRTAPTQIEILLSAVMEIDSLYQTEDNYFEALCKRIPKAKTACKQCGSQNIERAHGDRIGICNVCNAEVWPTSDTLFHGIRSARPWVLCICLLERGVRFNANQLHKVANVAQSSAAVILKKILLVVNNQLEQESLAIAVDSARYMPIFSKRSLETPANDHPNAEQEEMENRMLGNRDPEGINAPAAEASILSKLSEPAQKIYKMLSTKPIHFNDLCTEMELPIPTVGAILSRLEIEGLIEKQPGDRWVRSNVIAPAPTSRISLQSTDSEDISTGTHTDTGAFINLVKSDFHGISRKYLQLYLAAYWCQGDKGTWSAGTLLKACSRASAISYSEIRCYISPLFVRVMPDPRGENQGSQESK
jgi:DNA-binding MarR family transcriptional regulator